MGAAKKLVDKKALRDLVPLNALSPMHVDEVAAKAIIEEVRAGRFIFRQGDRDNQSIYVLNGEVSIIGDDNEVLGSVHGGADNARHPIGHQQPRQVSARAKSNVIVARIDSSLLDILLTWDESSGYEVSEIDSDDEDDWMTRMLQSPAFMQLPPANIQQLLMKMESLPVTSGEVIVRQGDEGDYFYVITSGRCVVTRKATAQGKEVKLAELGDGASFGEDALVSNNKRNATITMLTDGTLMRLAKKDFQELLQAPLVHQVSYEQAATLAEDGAIWLDVRLPGEFENGAIPGARNIPLSGLRDPSTRLEEDSRYILCCDTGRRSASGAFVLSQRGLDVYVLEGGLHAVPASVLVQADGSPAHASPAASADVIPLDTSSEPVSTVDTDGDARLQDLKARYDREMERIKEFQETARQTIQSAQQARKAAEEKSNGLQAQLQEAQAALARAEAGGGADDTRIQELEKRLEQAGLAQEQLRGELSDAQETQAEAEARLKQYEQQMNEAREAGRRELVEAQAELEASRQQIAELEQEQSQSEARLQQLHKELEAGQGDSTRQLEQLSGELETVRAELVQARTTLETAEQARTDLEKQRQDAQRERDELQARLEAARQEVRGELGERQQQIEGLQSELVQLRRSHEELGSRASQLAAERDASREQLVVLRQEQAGLQQRLDEQHSSAGQEQESLRAERDAARAEAEQARTRVAELEQSLQGGSQELSELQTQVSRYEEQLRERQEAAASAAQEAAARETDALASLREAQEQLQALQKELEERDNRLTALDTALQEQGALQESRQQEMEALRMQLDERGTELDRLRQEVEAASGREGGLQAQLDTLRQESEAALAEARTQVESAQQALGEEKETLQQELERVRADLAASSRALEQREAEQQDLTRARQEAEAALAERAALEAGLREELGRLEQSLEEAHSAAAAAVAAHASELAGREQDLGQQITALQEELASREAGVAELESGQQQLQAELATAREARQELEQELVAVREQDTARQAQQEAELQARQQEITRLESELASLKGGEADLDAERQRLQQELETAQAELVKAREQDAERQAQQEAELQARQQEITRLESELASLKGGEADLDAERQHLQQELETAQAELVKAREQETERQQLQQELEAARAELASAQEQENTAAAEREQQRQGLAEQEALVASVRAELVEATQAREQERGRLQEQLDEARQALEKAREELTRLRTEQADATARSMPSPGLESRIATLEEQLEQAQSEAQELRTREQVMFEEIDKLRAEAEVAQGLAELHGEGSGGKASSALEQELAQARQNVQIAVRLRGEAEEGRNRAEMELRRLQESLATQDTDQALRTSVVEVPSLDEPEEMPEATPAAAVTPTPPAPVPEPSRAGGGPWMGVLLGLVMGLAGAAGGFYLFQSGPNEQNDEPASTEREAPVSEAKPAETVQASPPASVAPKTPAREPELPAPAREPVSPAPAPVVEPAWEPVVRRFSDPLSDDGRGPRMVELRATEFQMGSGPGSPNFEERPRHSVQLKAFAIAVREVSFAEYDRFAEATGRSLPDDMGWGRGDRPVMQVSWEDARAYAEWLSAQTGRRYRLPTEAEWEYAARGGKDTRYWWGNDMAPGQANCHDCGSDWDGRRTAPAGSFAANPFGLHDMHGNVQEWVQDCYQDDYQDAPGDGRAVETAGCSRRVVRGGGYASVADSLRSTARAQLAPDSRLDHVGFRVARDR